MSPPSNRKYYEREDGYVYSQAELEAYRINHRMRSSKCINLYVPLDICLRNTKQSFMSTNLDPKKGECHKEFETFDHCQQIFMDHQQAGHVANSFYRDESRANALGMSPTLAGYFYKTPMSYTF